MKGLLTTLKGKANGKPGVLPPALPPPTGAPDGVVFEDEDVFAPYEVRDPRPWTQLAVRIGLWVAVGFGCVGGVLALFGLTTREGDDVVVQQSGDAGGNLPAPVAVVAQEAVTAWLTEDDLEELAQLFVEPPSRPVAGEETPEMAIGSVTPMAGGSWYEGYWLVTLAVDMHECLTVTEEEAELAEDEGTLPTNALVSCEPPPPPEDGEPEEQIDGVLIPHVTTLFVEVGVVGQVESGLSALATPSIVTQPDPVSEDWGSLGGYVGQPDLGDPKAAAVEGFLQAWLAGVGDVSLYLAPDTELELLAEKPFASVSLEGIAIQEVAETYVRTQAQVLAVTHGGVEVPLTYEVELEYRAPRWEVVAHWGAPDLVSQPDGGSSGSADAEEAEAATEAAE